MEAEYNALSVAMRSVLPFQALVHSVTRGIGLESDNVATFKMTIWEDNAGALQLAHLKPNHIEICKIDSKSQRADILTKGLTKDKFESIRKLLCGW
jgi:hypothetical protein